MDIRDGEVLFVHDGRLYAKGVVSEWTREMTEYGGHCRETFQGSITQNYMRGVCGNPITVTINDCEDSLFSTQKPQINMEETFYMNWMAGSGAPTHQFTNQEDAEKEAARLAHAHQRQVVTLKAIVCTEPKLNVERKELREKALTA